MLPVLTAVTNPPVDTVATPLLPLVQVPPEVALERATVLPTQILEAPEGVIADGDGLTERVTVAEQPPNV